MQPVRVRESEHTSVIGWGFRICRFIMKLCNLWLAVILLALAFGSIGIYYVLPQDQRATFSPVLFACVVPLFVFTFSVVPLAILAILVTSFLTLVAKRKIKAAARRLKTTSPHEIAKETGIDLDDLVPILDRLMPAGTTADEEGGMPPKTE